MLCAVRLQDKSCEHLVLSCFDILARITLPASKRILELAKYIAGLAIVFFSFHYLCGEKIHGKGPWSFLQYREKSELDRSASEDKDPKKLNLWCTKSIFICLIAASGTLPSTVCQVQLLHLRESPCFSWEFLHQGLHMDFTLNSYWMKDKQCLDWGLELRPLFFLSGLPSCCTTETCSYFSVCFGLLTSFPQNDILFDWASGKQTLSSCFLSQATHMVVQCNSLSL